MAYFPMFVDLTEKPCLIVGGGKVAYRKALVLLDFGARVEIIAKEVCKEMQELSAKVKIHCRAYESTDCIGKTLVIAATDDGIQNHEIAEFCKKNGIPVNAVDQQEDCTFIFPSYVREKDVVAAFSSAGKSPMLTQYLKEEEKRILTETVGQLGDCLGKWRGTVQELFATGEERKKVYKKILDFGLNQGRVPTDEEVVRLLDKISLQ